MLRQTYARKYIQHDPSPRNVRVRSMFETALKRNEDTSRYVGNTHVTPTSEDDRNNSEVGKILQFLNNSHDPDLTTIRCLEEAILETPLSSVHVLHSALLNAYGRCSAREDVERKFNQLKSKHGVPSPQVYEHVIRCNLNSNDASEALMRLDEMVRFNLHPTTHTWNDFIEYYEKHGALMQAYNLMANASSTCRPSRNNWFKLMFAFGRAMALDEEIKTFYKIKSLGFTFDIREFNILLDSHGRKGRVDDMLKFLEEMEDLNIVPNDVTRCTILTGLGNAQRIEDMMQLFESMKPDITTCNPWNTVLSTLGKKEISRMASLFQELKQSSVRPDAYTYGILINAFANAGMKEETKAIIEEAAKTNFITKQVKEIIDKAQAKTGLDMCHSE
eukprot:TRINITY_DN9439_c0_g1_i2.p1 TRINITY_DN9439_c0_g1~~TRINITY_DN9439_c0_g1_i2.p1  ORF type:complete len:389 (+),score=78.08 TRINITY_DN9439_c0_g1_i2:71-1237(+)